MDEIGGIKSEHRVLGGEDWRERFREMLGVMDTEHLIRFRHRLQKQGYERMVALLTLEIGRREE
jgi:hypothetical protein